MKHTMKRLTAIFLTLCMLLSVLPLGAFAASDPAGYVFDIGEGNITIVDGDTAGKIKVNYGDGRTTEEFDPSQVITVTGTVNGGSLVIDTATPVTIKASNLTINNAYVNYVSPMLLNKDAANVTLVLEGENLFVGGRDQAGIVVETGRTLTITGSGSVEARAEDHSGSSSFGAGIGGRVDKSCGTVIIESGTVTAIGNDGGADIGGGSDTANTGTLTVDGDAWVTAANIGGTKTLTKGVVNGTVYGDVTLTTDRTIDDLTIPEGASLTVPEGKTLTVNGTVTNNGTLTAFDDSSLAGEGSLVGSGSFVAIPSITVAADLVETGEVLNPGATLGGSGFSFGGAAFTVDTTGWTGPVYNPTEVKNAGEYTVSFTKNGVTVSKTFTVDAPAKYTVTFKANGYQVAQYTVRGGETLPEIPAVPETYGYTGKWDTDLTQPITGDMTVTAKYKAVTCYIQYRLTEDRDTTVTSQAVDFNKYFTPVAYTWDVPDGQSFLAWRGKDGNLYVPGLYYLMKNTNPLVVTPVFENNTEYWTVKFVGENGYLYDVAFVEKTSDATVALPVYGSYPQATWVCGGAEYNATETVPVTGDMTFTVNAAELHTVRFVADGYLVSEQQVRHGDMVQYVPAVPEKAGYSGKWSVDLDVFGAFITSDMTVTAVYTANEYTYSYYDENSVKYDEQTVTFGEWFSPLTFTGNEPDGKHFIAWEGDNGQFFVPGLDHKANVAADLDLYPVFDSDTEYWTVKFVGEDGAIYDVELVEQKSNAKVTLPVYAEYPAATWMLGNDEYEAGKTVPVSGDTTFTVKAPALFTVTFKANGYQVAQYTVRDGETLPEIPAVPETYGYYGKWDTDLTQPITGDLTVTAEYKAVTCYIQYRLAEAQETTVSVQPVDFGRYFRPIDYTWDVPDGQSFLGWRGKDGNLYVPGLSYLMKNTNPLVVTPLFENNTEYWTVRFCHPDGSLENVYLVEKAATEGAEFFIADKEYSLYPDAKWELTSGVVDGLAVGETVSTNYITVRSDVVFTAVVPDTYTILFYSEEGYLMDVRFVMENELIGAGPAAPAKEGYTFVGWQDESGNLLDDTTVATQDAVYTPVYEKILYPITLVPSDHVALGVLPESAMAGVGDVVTIGTLAEAGYETYYVCVYYQKDGAMIPVAITPLPANDPYDTPDTNGYTFVMPAGPVAVWVVEQANRNTVKFLVDGTIYGFEYILSGEAPAAPVAPVKEGYTFIGWKALSTGKEYPAGTEFDPIYADETYVALFEINTYDLTYYRGEEADASEYKCILALPDGTFVEFFNNDTTNMPTYVLHDVTYGDVIELAEPMLPGYVFQGWLDEDGYLHPAGANYVMPAGDVLLTAVWEEDTELSCLVRFVDNGKLYDAFLAYDGQDATIPATDPAADGKTFIGWQYGENTYSNTGVKDFIVVASDEREMTFEAVWEDVLYTVTYTDYQTLTDIVYGTELVTLAAPEQEGYTFVAWQCAENGAYYFANTAFTVKSDMTFTAVWAKNDVEYTVKFFDENGNLYDLFVAEEGTELTAPVYEQGKPNTEYVWVDLEHNSFLLPRATFTADADCSYRATVVEEATYPVTVYVEASGESLDNVAVPTQSEYLLGETACVAITVPEGYVLKNVYAAGTDNELLPIKDSLLPMGAQNYLYIFEMPAAPVTVLVELEKIPAGYTAVKFVSDGDLYDYVLVQKGSNGFAPETAPVKAGYTFVEWRSGTSFVAPGGEFAVPADAEDVIVYTAEWEAVDYMVEYRPDGGMPDPEDVHELHYGDKITLAAAPVKEGYTFIGWVEESTGFVYGEGSTYTVTGSAVFTAKWERGACVVRFVDPDSGIIYGYEAVAQGEQVTAPAAPAVSGKTFLYWVNAADDTDRVLASSQTPALYADTVYHAVYETSKHTVTVSTEHCAVAPASFGAKEVGELVEFTVTPDSNYALELVTVSYFDGTSFVVRELKADDNGTYAFYMPDADVTITAKAVQNVYSIFTRPGAYTAIDLVDGNKAAVGQTVLFVVTTTDEAYELNNVIAVTASGKPVALTVIHIDDVTFGYAFTMPAEDVTILTDAVQGERTVTFLDSDNTLLGIVAVGAGEFVTDAPVAAREGYTFAGWEKLPEKTPYDPARDAVTENIIVRATYVGDAHTVAAGLTENVHALRAECTVTGGNVNSSDLLQTALNAETGKTVYFTVAADYDYVVTDVAVVSAEGTDLVVEPTLREKKTVDNIVYYTYSFTMPAEDVKIDVYTAAKLFTTSVVENIPEGGTYTINGFYTSNLLITQGETVTIDITPAEGYIVKNVYGEFTDNFSQISNVDGTLDGNTFTFPMVAKDVVVYIEYEAITYGIDVETSNFATYKPDASVNPAKVVESLDPNLTSQGLIRIVGVEDRDYTNALEQIYKIPANGGATNGTRVAFTVTEFTGYDLASVTVTYDNGECTCPLTLKDGVYYFDMPADDVIITAVFTEETYTVTKDAASEAHGDVVMNGLTENVISADYKDEVTVTVTPDAGWQVSKIYYVLADGSVLDFDAASYAAAGALTDALDTEHSITFHMPASDVTVYAEYTAIDYTVNVDTQEASVEVYYSPSNVGEQVSFETAVNYGYIISKVYVVNDTTGERVYHHTASTNQLYGAYYTFTMPASSVTIHVETVKDEYNVKYLDNGALIAYESIEYLDTANVAAHVDKVVNGKPGYHFVGWVSADVQTPVTVPSVTDSDFVVVKDTFIYAAYEKDEIDVFFTATEHGTVTELSTGNTAEYRLDTTVFGDTVEFTAVPDEGYVVDTVSVTTTNGEGYNLDVRYTEAGGKYTFVIPATYKDNIHVVQAEDVIVTVTFKKDAFTLTKAADCGTEGTIAVNGAVTTQTSFTYEYQDEVTITATPNAGWYVVSITAQNADGSNVYSVTGAKPATDTPVGDSLTLSFQMPAEDLTYTVVYAKIDYSITTVFDATQGTVTTEPADIAQLDDVVTVTVEPKEGYELASLTVTYADGEKSCVLTEIGENIFTFTMPADGVVVTAVFTEVTYTANLTIVGEGTGTLNGFYTDNMPADYLDTVTVNATPAIGWELVSVTVDGGKIEVNEAIQPDGGDYTFTMPAHDVDIVVTFEKTGYGLASYALNFFEEGHGTVTLSPEETAHVGDRVVVIADPDDGYRVKSVTVLDEYGYAVPVSFVVENAAYEQAWSFTMPAASVDIYVVFEVQGASYYDDVRTDDWFYTAVTFVTDRGYFFGVSEDLFAPYMNMNRAMFVTVLGRMEGVDVSKYTGTAFSDVEAGSYYAPYVAWANENGIVLGRTAEIFDPYADITREEMAAIMYRYCDYLGMDMTIDNEQFMERYIDRDDISGWAVTYIEWAVGAGLIHGMTPYTINPLDYATRAQVAQVIKNLCDKVIYE